MKFCWSTLRVSDMEKSLQFYTEVIGLAVVNRFTAGPGLEIAFLGQGETQVELICDGSGRTVSIGEDISWGFEVSSLEESLALLSLKGIPIEAGPIQPNPGIRFLYIRDPDGMKIQLVEHLSQAVPSVSHLPADAVIV